MACLGDCLDMSPPPDGILFMPPPPAPLFIFPKFDNVHQQQQNRQNFSNCLTQTCDAAIQHQHEFSNSIQNNNNYPLDRTEYMEMPKAETKWNVSGIGDTWLLVLVASSIGVLLLGALLAMFLLKCREMNLFNNSEHCSLSLNGQLKSLEPRDCNNTTLSSSNGGSKLHPVNNASFYTPSPRLPPDNRMVWAAMTPRGTEHFISGNYSRNLMCYETPADDHYESIDHLPSQNLQHHNNRNDNNSRGNNHHVAYYGYHHKDYDYEDPTPLIENYQMDDIAAEYDAGDHQYQIIGNLDMRCSNLGFHHPLSRPTVSSPTRIEHPNLPPLNILPQRNATLKRNVQYRTGTLSSSSLTDTTGRINKFTH